MAGLLLSLSVIGQAQTASRNFCDLNGDGAIDRLDVAIADNQAVGEFPCTNADLDRDGACTATDVQRVSNAASGLGCAVGPGGPAAISSISPEVAFTGGADFSLTVNGAGFIQGGSGAAVVQWNGTALSTTLVGATQFSAQLVALVPHTLIAVPGVAKIAVVSGGSTSALADFSILTAAPTLTSLSPNSGAKGANLAVTLTGTNFVSGATIAVSNPGVTVSNLIVVNATQITATFTIAPNAATGPASVTVNTSAGASSAISLTITEPLVPTLTSIAPNTGLPGTSVPVTLTGNNFVSGSTLSVSNPGLTVTNVNVVNTTQITATFAVATTAPAGPTNVTVANPAGISAPVTFTVVSLPPTLSSVAPTGGIRGATVPVTLTGNNFVSGATITVSNGIATFVTVNSVTVVSPTQMTANFVIAPDAPLGPAAVTVATASGTSAVVNFTIVSAAVTLTSISPNSGARGASVAVTLTGNSFLPGASVSVGNPGVTVTNVNVVNSIQITATFGIAANAALGPVDVTVTSAGVTTAPVNFAVVLPAPPPPTLTSINPNTAAQGATVPVTLAGSDFVSGATITVSNAGITVNNVAFGGAAQLTATFLIAANAPLGSAGVTVTTPGGTSASLSFTVTAAPANLPTIAISGGEGSSINPLGTKTFSIVLASAPPTPTTGTLTLQFTGDAVNPVPSDPEVAFVSGTTRVNNVTFGFSPGQTQAVLSPADAVVQAGTVAGTISVLISSYQGSTPPNNLVGTTKISRTAPQITNVKLANKTASGFDICVSGYSPTRDVTGISYQFTASGQGTLQNTQLVAGNDLAGKFTSWFQNANSVPTGGQFLLDQTFTVSGSDAAIASITVTLQNGTGSTTSTSVPYSGFASSCN